MSDPVAVSWLRRRHAPAANSFPNPEREGNISKKEELYKFLEEKKLFVLHKINSSEETSKRLEKFTE